MSEPIDFDAVKTICEDLVRIAKDADEKQLQQSDMKGVVGLAVAYIAKCEEADGFIQTSGDLCDNCGWRGVRDGGCEFCRVEQQSARISELESLVRECAAEGWWSEVYTNERIDAITKGTAHEPT